MPRTPSDHIKEQKHEYLILKQIKGINTQPSREAIGEDEAAWLENLMPIGPAYIPAVPQVGAPVATVGAAISFMKFANLGTVNYQICFTSAGGAEAINLATNATVTVAPGGTFTTPSMDQWKSERIVIGDSNNGYFSWDGTLFHTPGSVATVTVTAGGSGFTTTPVVSFSGGGGANATAVATLANSAVASITITAVGSGYTSAPTVGFTGGGGSNATASASIVPVGQNADAISVYSGRVWFGKNRTLTYTAPNSWYDVSAAAAAGSTTITEGSLRQRIYALEALDNYLYVFGDSSIIIIGDLKVTGSITTFSLTFLSSTTGTTLQNSITALERAIIFMNKYGVYALFGASVQKISKALDGIFPDIDFSQSVSAGLVQIYNILCYAVNFTYNDDGMSRQIQAVFFDGKWFTTSQGALTFISPASLNGLLSLWGTTGSDLRQLYTNTTATIATTLQTGLYALGNPIFDKQAIRAGLEFTAPAQASSTLQLDTENASQAQQFNAATLVNWTNSSGSTVTWTNTLGLAVGWLQSGFILQDTYFDITGKYLGFTVTSNSPMVTLNGILSEYEQRASW
jgi:hypothetical protein